MISADGRVFNIPVHQMPGSRGYGEPLMKFIELKADVLYMGVLKKDQLWLLSANSGYGFLTQAESLSVTQKAEEASLYAKTRRATTFATCRGTA